MTIEITSVKLSHGVVTIKAIDCSEEHLQYMERCRDDGFEKQLEFVFDFQTTVSLFPKMDEGTESGQTGNHLGGCFKCNYWHCNNN